VTFVITQPCVDVQDQSCVEVCPVDCIHFEEGEDRMLYIDPVACIDCGACEPACPVDAIFDEVDVPDDQAHFTAINELWFDDRAAARAQVGGDGAPAAAPPAPEPAEETAPEPEPAAAEAPAEAEAEAPVEEDAAEEAPAVAAAAAPAPVPAGGGQVEAVAPHGHGPAVNQYKLPSAVSLIAFFPLMLSLAAIFIAPGPTFSGAGVWDVLDNIRFGDVNVGNLQFLVDGLDGPSQIGVVIAILLAPPSLLLFLYGQGKDMRLFAAKHERQVMDWREAGTPWRRSEESRQFEIEVVVRQLARDRFEYPNESHPQYHTYTNLPTPTLALEFTAGGASTSQVFPDIVVVEQPRNRPVIVAQVETRETVTREQAELVWAPLETGEAPLYIYVPSGLVRRAKDYAMAAGIKNAKFRSWRRQPTGMLVQEV
jgi:NAD-dependent dihydropyrimidine dehydrogenase PreA subunit